jgi:hypothetical protein
MAATTTSTAGTTTPSYHEPTNPTATIAAPISKTPIANTH